MDYFVLGNNGEKYGPADIVTLNVWISEGRINQSSQLINVQTGVTIVAGQAPGLMFPATNVQQPNYQIPPANYQQNSFGTPYQNQYGQPPNPYPRGYSTTPPKSKIAAGLLALFLGGLGIHRFYLGFNTIGITMLLLSTVGGLLTCGITSAAVSVWALVEAILIFCTNFQDADGRDLI
jgi:TM2 domain-containing membrane protein YozV